ncbi:tail fiber domain-containing protein [bacterium]
MKRQFVLCMTCVIFLFSISYAQMTVTDSDTNVLMQVNDEGTTGSITLPTGSAPSTTTDKLYNISGALYWGGSMLTTAGSAVSEIDDLTDGKTGGSSVFLGSNAGFNDDDSNNFNVGVGDSALFSNTSGYNLTAVGYQALASNTDRWNNSAFGFQALKANSTGYQNTAIGHQVLAANVGGTQNTATGHLALSSNTSGNNNTAYGHSALSSSTAVSNSTAIGSGALAANTSGLSNTAIGSGALTTNTSGSYNTATGFQALLVNLGGSNNTAFGNGALKANTSGTGNTAVGHEALNSNSTLDINTAIGYLALTNNTGAQNVGCGASTLTSNMTGSNNTACGTNSLSTNVTGDGNTAVGYNADVSTSNLTNATAIGANTNANASHQIRLGNGSITTFYCMGAYAGTVGIVNRDVYVDNAGKIGYVSSSVRYKENITNMSNVDWLYDLRPVSFTYKTDENHTVAYGLIAEEVQIIKPEFVSYNSEGKPETVSYSSLISPLLKAVQDQQKQIEALKVEIKRLKDS